MIGTKFFTRQTWINRFDDACFICSETSDSRMQCDGENQLLRQHQLYFQNSKVPGSLEPLSGIFNLYWRQANHIYVQLGFFPNRSHPACFLFSTQSFASQSHLSCSALLAAKWDQDPSHTVLDHPFWTIRCDHACTIPPNKD